MNEEIKMFRALARQLQESAKLNLYFSSTAPAGVGWYVDVLKLHLGPYESPVTALVDGVAVITSRYTELERECEGWAAMATELLEKQGKAESYVNQPASP